MSRVFHPTQLSFSHPLLLRSSVAVIFLLVAFPICSRQIASATSDCIIADAHLPFRVQGGLARWNWWNQPYFDSSLHSLLFVHFFLKSRFECIPKEKIADEQCLSHFSRVD
ncbi:uncharacterized protein LOC130740490 [Lotus japonicus]|uniref:uncharacterized protein LOC130740490 n=1 Tax=Lotus japonicus TaxID=34305 RepID=UPI00258E4CEC|nr:uncharacterized protein LOC130740490 [Lotus japonicus]